MKFRVTGVLVLAWAAESGLAVQAAGPVLPLPEADRRTIERDLGQGILGDAVPAPVIANPADYLRLQPHTARYRVVEDGAASGAEPFRLVAEPPGWRFRVGEQEEIFLKALADGSFVLTGIRQLEARALTRYDPPEPLLFQGLEPGGERKVSMGIRVYDEDEPDEVIHQGRLDMTFRYLGAYRLAVPAGGYDTVLMKSTFKGRVGPAALEDTQYRFFAPGVGLVATIEHRRLSALIFYRSELKVARLLESL
jgi:hypothetical protein